MSAEAKSKELDLPQLSEQEKDRLATLEHTVESNMSQGPNWADWAKHMPTNVLKRDLEIRRQNTKPGDRSDGFIEAVQGELEKRDFEELKKKKK